MAKFVDEAVSMSCKLGDLWSNASFDGGYILSCYFNLFFCFSECQRTPTDSNIPKRKLKTKLDEALTLPYSIDRRSC